MEKKIQRVEHTLDPIWNAESRVLILGTMPSPKSREKMFYYAHPQNRFWRVMEAVFGCRFSSDEEKTDFLLSCGIALWDVVQSCEIQSASDSSIRNVVPNDVAAMVNSSKISAVFTTGTTAYRLYNKYCCDSVGIDAVCLPSTSPANARKRVEDLVEEYRVLRNYL